MPGLKESDPVDKKKAKSVPVKGVRLLKVALACNFNNTSKVLNVLFKMDKVVFSSVQAAELIIADGTRPKEKNMKSTLAHVAWFRHGGPLGPLGPSRTNLTRSGNLKTNLKELIQRLLEK